MKPGQFISRKLGLGLFAAMLVLGFGAVVARSGPFSSIQVTTWRVEAGSLSPAIFGIGTVEARRSYFIGPTAAGRVKALHVDVGEAVKAGQLLAEIDPVDLNERLRSTDAAYARAASAVTAGCNRIRPSCNEGLARSIRNSAPSSVLTPKAAALAAPILRRYSP